jgi:hypothetical protein
MEDDLKTIKTTLTKSKSKSNKRSKHQKQIKIKTMVVAPLWLTQLSI